MLKAKIPEINRNSFEETPYITEIKKHKKLKYSQNPYKNKFCLKTRRNVFIKIMIVNTG